MLNILILSNFEDKYENVCVVKEILLQKEVKEKIHHWNKDTRIAA